MRWSSDGYCTAHGRHHCERCRKADERESDWGVFEWERENRYRPGSALKTYRSRSVAQKAADRMGGNVVVRSVPRGYSGGMQTPALTQNPKTLAPNPIGAGAGLAIAAAVGVVAWLVLRKKDEEPAPGSPTPRTPGYDPPASAVCPIDAGRIAAWGTTKQMGAFYLGPAVRTPPDFAALATQFSIVTSMGEGKVVIAVGPSGSFYRYSGGQPVAAPELRAEYCAAQQTVPFQPSPLLLQNIGPLQGVLHSPVFL